MFRISEEKFTYYQFSKTLKVKETLCQPHHSNPKLSAVLLRYTHHWVRIIAANVQRTICQVKASEAAGSLWKGEGRAGRILLHSSQPAAHQPNTHAVCRTAVSHDYVTGWKLEVRNDEEKKHMIHVIKKLHSCCPFTGHWNYAYLRGPECP